MLDPTDSQSSSLQRVGVPHDRIDRTLDFSSLREISEVHLADLKHYCCMMELAKGARAHSLQVQSATNHNLWLGY